MIGDVYALRSMRWKVTEAFQDQKEMWAELKCLDRNLKPWKVPLTFLDMMKDRRVVS